MAVTKKRRKAALHDYRFVISTGETYYVRARTQSEANDLLQKKMIGLYGHGKGVRRYGLVTAEEKAKYPVIFKPKQREWKAMENPKGVRTNPSKKTKSRAGIILPLAILAGLFWWNNKGG